VAEAYSPLKALRYPDRLRVLRDGGVGTPVHVQIILSDLCNQACGFCAYRDPGYTSSQLFYEISHRKGGLRRDGDHPERNYNPNRMIPYDKVIEILDDCVELGVKAIQFTGGGEPTVHPRFADILNETHRRGLKFAVVTNGVLPARRPEMLYALAGAEWVRVSLDAGASATYAQLRNVPESHFHDALETIERLAGSVHLGVGYVVTPQNWREIVQGAGHAKRCGADNVRISAQFSADGESLFADCYDDAAAEARIAERLTDERFTVYNRFGEKLDDLRQRSPDYDRCGYQEFTTYVGGDQNVYRCCVLAYNERGLIGSIREQRFRDLWMSAARADAMRSFDARGCDRCQFNAINRTLDYTLRPAEPMHSAFV
jgi:MoaA/NifB/PqqE/SkfB family radical SAM enzyme